MSRPPRPLFRTATTGDGSTFAAQKHFLSLEFTDFVKLERELAESEFRLGVTKPPDRTTEHDPSGDFAATLMELSALVGHTLGLYQNLYAREAYLGTAETSRSLVLHARRLAYEPDQGLAASGYAVLTVGEGLKGTLPAGFALASSPRGEVKAQTFETIEDVAVDAARNEALPVNREQEATMTFAGRKGTFRLAGTALDLAEGEYGILLRESTNTWEPVSVLSLDPDEGAGSTSVEVELLASGSDFADSTQPLAAADGSPLFRFLAMPKERLQRFGWDANPVEFPPADLNSSGEYTAPTTGDDAGTTAYGYKVTLESGAGYRTEDTYLSTAIRPNLAGQLVIARVSDIVALRVEEQGTASVAFCRGKVFEYSTGGDPATAKVVVGTQISGAVTYLRLQTSARATIARSASSLAARIYTDWQFDEPILATEPNRARVSGSLMLDVDFGDFRPGEVVVFEKLDGSFAQVVEVHQLTIAPEGTTEIHWVELTDPPASPASDWTLDNIRVFGNVARVTHGETAEEVLGGSDGVTPFQRFELKKAPLTQVPGANGGEPAIEVRVNEVAWTPVEDFSSSRPDDRHYRLEFDEEQKASVIFGNGRNGAIPPSGRKHIRAIYRHGLGVDGNGDAGAASRIKKTHPLIDRAVNPTSILGGADPAGLTDLERQATQFIRTFNRAVSVRDHADLALLFPGVARAAARTTSGGRIEVIVATAEGAEPPLASVEAFIEARRDTTLPMEVLGPEAVDVFLSLVIEHDPAYLTENIKRAVQDALVSEDAEAPGMFTFQARDFGQAAHLSEIYARVAAVEGVTFVDVTRFRLEDDSGVSDVAQVNARQWLRLLAANLSLSITPGATA